MNTPIDNVITWNEKDHFDQKKNNSFLISKNGYKSGLNSNYKEEKKKGKQNKQGDIYLNNQGNTYLNIHGNTKKFKVFEEMFTNFSTVTPYGIFQFLFQQHSFLF